ncbi:10815_t:CDS:2 [Cetraspora pellucida]|uniref:10815_t:CDS:1 n=1 Tax=Cetraspora pellucida TaxID=1433469 RepID=A0A9N9GWN1_9GLOM|nr:10815_t:CDS:2 [Cetraspora pellucida]
MDVEHGATVFLYEIEDGNEWIEKEIRVIGTLKYIQLSTETAILEQYLNHSKHRLIVDTRLIENIGQYCSDDMIELFGKLTWDATPGPGIVSRNSQLPPEFRVNTSRQRVPMIRAHVIRDVQGINMTLYQEITKLRRRFNSKFNDLMESEELKAAQSRKDRLK